MAGSEMQSIRFL